MEVRRPTSQPFPSQFTALQGILDFSKEFDVSLMDRVVMAFYSGTGQEVRPNGFPTRSRQPHLQLVRSNNSPNKF